MVGPAAYVLLPRANCEPTVSRPSFTVTPPVMEELALVSASVPRPFLVSDVRPESVPLRVATFTPLLSSVGLSTEMMAVVPLEKATEPLAVSAYWLGAKLSWLLATIALANGTAAPPASSRVLSASVSVPEPSAVALPRMRFP